MTVSRWLKGLMPRKPSTKVHKSTLVIDIIKTSIMNDPFISIIKLQDIIKNTLSVSVLKELVRQAIKRQGWTKKKARYYGVSKALPEKQHVFLKIGLNFCRLIAPLYPSMRLHLEEVESTSKGIL
jgi:hypothetical protein